jgi:hypothetical protein
MCYRRKDLVLRDGPGECPETSIRLKCSDSQSSLSLDYAYAKDQALVGNDLQNWASG